MMKTALIPDPVDVGVGQWRLHDPPAEGSIVERREVFGVPCALYDSGSVQRWRILDPAEPIPVDYVELVRAEGRTEECGIPVQCRREKRKGDGKGGLFHDDWEVSAFTNACSTLLVWGRTAPKGREYDGGRGGYDKCDFRVLWTDGSEYGGRFDLQYGGTDAQENFRESMMSRLRFYAGLAPTNTNFPNREAYLEFVNQPNVVGLRDLCRHVLAKCEL